MTCYSPACIQDTNQRVVRSKLNKERQEEEARQQVKQADKQREEALSKALEEEERQRAFANPVPTTSSRISVAEQIKRQQDQNTAIEEQRKRTAEEDEQLRKRLDSTLEPYAHDVFLELKNAGVAFENAEQLYNRAEERLKVGADVFRTNLSSLNALSPEFITFTSFDGFNDPINYSGAFSIEGTSKLISYHGRMDKSKESCLYFVEAIVYIPEYIVAMWEKQESKKFSCDSVLSGSAAPQIKNYMLTIAKAVSAS